MVSPPRVLGVVGWSGSGKTTLLVKLIALYVSRGLRVATLKHAHHEFDVDHPGKDSYEHRAAGASEVVICSARRWVQMHELGAEAEPSLAQLLQRLSACDLVLIEGFKTEQHAKLEVLRAATGKSPLYPQDPRILAVASDRALPDAPIPVIDLNDLTAVASTVLDLAEPLDTVLARLSGATPHS